MGLRNAYKEGKAEAEKLLDELDQKEKLHRKGERKTEMAKPVGVAFADHGEGFFAAIVVVCDDGSVWAQQDLGNLSTSGWHEVAPVPGTPREEELIEEKKLERLSETDGA